MYIITELVFIVQRMIRISSDNKVMTTKKTTDAQFKAGSPPRPNRFWKPPSLISSGYHTLILRV